MKSSDVKKFWQSKKRELIEDYEDDVADGSFDEVMFSIEHELDIMTDEEFERDVSEEYESYDSDLHRFVMSLDFENGSGDDYDEDDDEEDDFTDD